MHILFKAGAAFAIAALILGHTPLSSPHWRAVADDLHHAQPQARMRAAILSLFHDGKG